jgi:hypothetical protein
MRGARAGGLVGKALHGSPGIGMEMTNEARG